jgi:hypothetical protein
LSQGLFPKRVTLAGALVLCIAGMLAAVPAANAASFASPVVVTGDDLGEPGIDVAKDGTIYVNAPTGLLSNVPGSPSDVFRSTDGGASWVNTPAGARSNLPGGGDSDISLDPNTGKIYMTDLWLGSATVSTSSDKGQTWTANPVEGTPIQDRQWISTPGGDIAYHLTHQIPSGLVVSKSVDGGVTFPVRTVAATPADQTGCICPPGNLISQAGTGALGTNDRVGFVYATSTGGVNFARSTNGGLTFTQSTVGPASDADTTQAFPVVADAGGDHLVSVWLENVGNSSRIRYSDSTDWGSSWVRSAHAGEHRGIRVPVGRGLGFACRGLAVPRRCERNLGVRARERPVVRDLSGEHRQRCDVLGPADRGPDPRQERSDLHRGHGLQRRSRAPGLPVGGARRIESGRCRIHAVDRRQFRHGAAVRARDGHGGRGGTEGEAAQEMS